LGCKNKTELQEVLIRHGSGPNSELFDTTTEKSLEWIQLILFSRIDILPMWKFTSALSCWHANNTESDAMWELYARRSAGIAFKSSARRMIAAFKDSEKRIDIAKVQYDINGDETALSANINASILIKRPAFQHENEVRLIADCLEGFDRNQNVDGSYHHTLDFSKSDLPAGVSVPCNFDELIEEIVISPLMELHYESAILRVLEKFLPNCRVRKSTLFQLNSASVNCSPGFLELWTHYRKTHLLLDFPQIEEMRPKGLLG
jgi:hypothetical protein